MGDWRDLFMRQFAGYPRIGGAARNVRVTPGFGPWKQLVETATLESGARPWWWWWRQQDRKVPIQIQIQV